MSKRTETLKELFVSKAFDGYMIANEKNMLYFTGFSEGVRLIVPSNGESILFARSVNYEAALEKSRNARVELIKMDEDTEKKVADEINRLKLRRVGFDTLTISNHLKLKENLKETQLEPAEEIVWSLRKVKDETELAFLKKAAKLTDLGMEKAFEVADAGLKEYELAAEIEYEMRRRGSEGFAFNSIISSGPSSAFPHGWTGDRRIREGDFVMIDIGARYRGYCADLTRTLIIGKPSSRQAEIYETVKKAQETALSQMKAGVEARRVDESARGYIDKMGYEKYFVHGLGHGVGLDVHEPPSLGPASKDVLSSGNVVTVEPGIYIPKFGGVRIEDTVQVLSDGCMKLTEASLH